MSALDFSSVQLRCSCLKGPALSLPVRSGRGKLLSATETFLRLWSSALDLELVYKGGKQRCLALNQQVQHLSRFG